jgi:hypothetical protein
MVEIQELEKEQKNAPALGRFFIFYTSALKKFCIFVITFD